MNSLAISLSVSTVLVNGNLVLPRQADAASLSAQSQSCLDYVKTCPVIVDACVPNYCKSCASFGGPDLGSCCGVSTAAQCFSSLLLPANNTATITSDAGPTQTAPPLQVTGIDTDASSCSSALDKISSCNSATPGFTVMDDGLQASCLCYSDSTYDPKPFDDLQSACVRYASTADATAVSVFSAAAGVCTRVGDVRSASPGGSITSGASATSSRLGAVGTKTLSASSTTTGTSSAFLGSKTSTAIASRPQMSLGWIARIFTWIFT